jgi:hypothetical protein
MIVDVHHETDVKINLSRSMTSTINMSFFLASTLQDQDIHIDGPHHRWLARTLQGFPPWSTRASDMARVEAHDRPAAVMRAASPTWMLSQIDQTCCSKCQLNRNKRLERGFLSNQDSRTVTCLLGKILLYFPLSPFLHLILVILLVDSTNGPVHWFGNMHLAYRNKCTQQRTRTGRYMLPWHNLAAASRAGSLHPRVPQQLGR